MKSTCNVQKQSNGVGSNTNDLIWHYDLKHLGPVGQITIKLIRVNVNFDSSLKHE